MSPPFVPLDAIRQPAVLFDASGRIAAANDLARAQAGGPIAALSADEFAGIFDIRSPDGAPFTGAGPMLSRALAGEEVIDAPFTATLADGRTLEILATASPVRDGDRVTGALVLWQDVTARTRAETALRESEEKYRALINASPDIILLLDVEGTVLAVNETFARILDSPVSETVGASIWERMPPGVIAFRRERFTDVLRSGRASRFEEFQDDRWFDTVVEPVLS